MKVNPIMDARRQRQGLLTLGVALTTLLGGALAVSHYATTAPNKQVARDFQTQETHLHEPARSYLHYHNRFTLGTEAANEALQARYDLLNWNTPDNTNRIITFSFDLPHD